MFRGIGRALRSQSYRRYTIGAALSVNGFWLQKLGVAWVTWELTESEAWLGVMAMVDALPSTFFSLFSGVVADRVERIRLIRFTQFGQSSVASLLAIFSLTGAMTIEILFGLVLLAGSIQAFAQPARHALYPSLVEPEDLSSAIAVNSSLFNLARFLGPALAGVLIAAFGVGVAFAVAAVAFTMFLIILFFVYPPARTEGTPRRISLRSELMEGFRYAIGHPAIGPILALIVAATVFSRSFYELLPAFSDRIFARGVDGLATLSAAVGVGAFISAIWLAGRGRTEGLTRIAITLVFAVAVSQAVFATTGTFYVAVVSMAIIGFATVATSISCQILLQNRLDDNLRGRVMSIYGVVFRNGPAVGALAMGALSERFGLRPVVLASAACCGLVWLWASGRRKRWEALLEVEPATS